MGKDANCGTFRECAVLRDELFEVAVVTVLRDDVRVVSGVEDVEEFKAILVAVELFQHIDFVEEKESLYFIFHAFHVYDLHRNYFFSLVVLSSVHETRVTFPYHVGKTIAIVLDYFLLDVHLGCLCLLLCRRALALLQDV